jgi:hypothetical protein
MSAGFSYPCDWRAAFTMDATSKQRCGYLMAFNGLDLNEAPTADNDNYKINVFTPFNAAGDPGYSKASVTDTDGLKTMDCIGVIENLSFAGGVGDPICISAYVSSEFASQIAAKQKASLSTTSINELGWWVINHDDEEKGWYEEAYPKGMLGGDEGFVRGQLNAPGGSDVRLSVANEGTKVSSTMDIVVYNLYFEVIPASDGTYVLNFAQAKSKPFVKGWGLQVGNVAKAKMS